MTEATIGGVLPATIERGQHKLHQVKHLLTGHWFHDVMVAYLRARARRPAKEAVHLEDPMGMAQGLIRKASIEAALLGTGAAAITTGASAWTAQSNGSAALWALPTAGAAMVGDMVTRAFVLLQMSCDIAELFGVTFDPDDPSDLARLHAVAHRAISAPDDADERGHDLLESLSKLEPEQISRVVGFSSNTETILRNIVPFVGLLTSSVTSYRLARRLGKTSLRYARARAAFSAAFAPIEQRAPQLIDLLLEGVWFVFTSDGALTDEDAAILSHLLHTRPEDLRRRLLDRFRDDEAGWLSRLSLVQTDMRQDFYHALCVAAAVDTEICETKRCLIRHVAEKLGVAAREEALDALAVSFRDTGHALH